MGIFILQAYFLGWDQDEKKGNFCLWSDCCHFMSYIIWAIFVQGDLNFLCISFKECIVSPKYIIFFALIM